MQKKNLTDYLPTVVRNIKVNMLNICVLSATDIFQLPYQRVSTKVCYLKGFAIGNVFGNLENVCRKQNTGKVVSYHLKCLVTT